MGDFLAHLQKGLIGANNGAQLTYKTTGLSIACKYIKPLFYAVGWAKRHQTAILA